MKLARHGRPAYPVRVVLLTLVGLATLPPIIFALMLLLHYADSQRGRAEGGLVVSARGVARSIDADFAMASATLNVLRNSTLLEHIELAGFAQRLRSTTLDTGQSFALIGMDGQVLINTVLPPRVPDVGRLFDEMTAAFEEQHLYISNVITDSDTGEPYAVVAVPIERQGQIKWILAALLYSEEFAGVIGAPGVPEDWIVSIVDRKGMHIRRSHLNDQYSGRPLVPELLEHIAAKETGTVRTISHEGTPLISTVAYGPRSGWAAAVGLPIEKLEEPLFATVRNLFLIGLAIATITLTMAFFVARALDRGFIALRRAARTLDVGEEVEPQYSSVREVNAVISTMAHVSRNLMQRGKALNELTNSLETQVVDRTSELVTEMKRREDSESQLRQMQRMEAIGQLTGGIAHDFSNMLAVVMSGLTLIDRHLKRGDTDVQQFIDGAMQGAEGATSLTRRLLAFSRQQALRPETVDCNALIDGMSDIVRRAIPEHIAIETTLSEGLWHTNIDYTGLENAILNLVVNARDAMPSGGKLTVETGNTHLDSAYASKYVEVMAGDYVMIAVSDTGSGIPKDIISNVFEPFFTTKEPGQGTGLGLSQVHGFIKQSGGHIKIYSERDEGTTVRLYLPRRSEDSVVAFRSRRDIPAETPLAQNNETILVAEDEAAVRSGTVGMLEELGYVVLEAPGGVEALGLLDQHPEIALVITDVVMPGMNGRQLADEATKRRPDLLVLFSSGYTRNAIVHNGILDAGVHLIAKPYTLDALAQKVSEMLSSAKG